MSLQIRFITDVHRETGPLVLEKDENDKDRVLLITGDLGVNEMVMPALKELAPGFAKVIYVPGNHEYEGANIDTAMAHIKAQVASTPELSNVSILDCDTLVYRGVRFVGATLWTDMYKEDWFAIHSAKEKVGDFQWISKGPHDNATKFTPRDSIALHYRHKQYIDTVLHDIPFDGPTVVATHHAPSFKSMDEVWTAKCGILTAIFASELDNMVGFSGAKYWFHGHIHSSRDYMIGDTRVIDNPRGNGLWGNPDFNPNLILEV